MFGFIAKCFPIKAKSLEDFAAAVKVNGCEKVTVEPYMASKGMGTTTATVGRIGNVSYAVEITAETPGGRKIIHKEIVHVQFQSAYGIADRPDRQKSAIRMYLVAEQKAGALKMKIPGVRIELIGPDDRPMNDAKFEQLHQDAMTAGITI